MIVWRVVRTRPAVPSAVSYEDVREGNAPSSALGHGTHSLLPGACTVRERCLCQPQAETGLDAGYGAHMGTRDKRRDAHPAKAAERLAPPGHGSGDRGSLLPCHGPPTLPADREPLPQAGQPCGTWSARIAPGQGGKPSGRPQAVRVEGWEKAKASLAWGGYGWRQAYGPHHPTRQRADCPAVARHANHGGIGTAGVAHGGGRVPLVLPSP